MEICLNTSFKEDKRAISDDLASKGNQMMRTAYKFAAQELYSIISNYARKNFD